MVIVEWICLHEYIRLVVAYFFILHITCRLFLNQKWLRKPWVLKKKS